MREKKTIEEQRVGFAIKGRRREEKMEEGKRGKLSITKARNSRSSPPSTTIHFQAGSIRTPVQRLARTSEAKKRVIARKKETMKKKKKPMRNETNESIGNSNRTDKRLAAGVQRRTNETLASERVVERTTVKRDTETDREKFPWRCDQEKLNEQNERM